MNELLSFLRRLEPASIHYTLSHHRDDAIMATVSVPGERWEVEFFCDGSVEVERFVSNGVDTGDVLAELFSKHVD